MSVFNLSSLW